MLISFLVPLGIGMLAGLGVGSGGLFILFLTEWVALPQHAAQGVNLGVFSIALATALLVHLRRHPPSPAILFVVLSFGSVGALVGASLATALSGGALRLLLGLFLALSGVFVLFRK